MLGQLRKDLFIILFALPLWAQTPTTAFLGLGPQGSGGGGSSKTPDQVTGLVAWHDFTTTSGLTCTSGCNDGNAITRANDHSGTTSCTSSTACDLVTFGGGSATFKTNIVNGHSIGRMSGTEADFPCCAPIVTLDLGQFTTFTVYNPSTVTSGSFHGGLSTSGEDFTVINGSSKIQAEYDATNLYTSTASVSASAWHLLIITRSNSTVAVYMDGTQDGTGSTTAATTHFFAMYNRHTTSDPLAADIGESGIYNNVISGADRQALCLGFKSKYNTSWTCN